MQGDPLPSAAKPNPTYQPPLKEVKEVLTMASPDTIVTELPWLAQSLMVDNYSATGYLYIRACKRYVPPGAIGEILHIPASREVNVVWQNPPNVGAVPTAGDLATITAFADLVPLSGGFKA